MLDPDFIFRRGVSSVDMSVEHSRIVFKRCRRNAEGVSGPLRVKHAFLLKHFQNLLNNMAGEWLQCESTCLSVLVFVFIRSLLLIVKLSTVRRMSLSSYPDVIRYSLWDRPLLFADRYGRRQIR